MAPTRTQSARTTRTLRMPPISSFFKVSKPISKAKFCSNLKDIFEDNDTARFRARRLCSDLDLTINAKSKPIATPAKPEAQPRYSVTGSPYFSPPTTAELDLIYPLNPEWVWTPFTPAVGEKHEDDLALVSKSTSTTPTQVQSGPLIEDSIAESDKSLKVRENAAYCSLQALVHGKTEICELGEGEFTLGLHDHFSPQRNFYYFLALHETDMQLGEENTAKQYMESFLTSIISRLADRAEAANLSIVSVTDVVAVLKEMPGWNNYYGFKPLN